MDLDRALIDLRAEWDRLHEVILCLEQLQNIARPDTSAPGRRGRKSMDDAARQQVSERMKRYWSRRKEKKETTAARD